MTELRAAFTSFAKRNIDWIDSVGVDVLAKLNMTALDFVNGIVKGLVPFNELAMLVLCWALNIHCVVLLSESYFSTQCLQKIDKCLIRLAYTGDSIFKEITTSVVAESKDTSSDSKHTSIDEADEGLESDQEDLQGTGLLEDGEDSGKSADQDSGVENNDDEEQVDVKPFILAPITFKSSEAIVIDSDSDSDCVIENVQERHCKQEHRQNTTTTQVQLLYLFWDLWDAEVVCNAFRGETSKRWLPVWVLPKWLQVCKWSF